MDITLRWMFLGNSNTLLSYPFANSVYGYLSGSVVFGISRDLVDPLEMHIFIVTLACNF